MTPINDFPERVRRRGLITLLIDIFCMYTGFFMVIPLISVHYVDGLGFAAVSIGLVLAVRQVVQQGLTVFGGVLADQIGAKFLICLGLTIRIVGFVIMAFAATLPVLFLSAVISAIGGALFESPRSAALAALTRPEERQRFYSLSGVIGGIGMAVGPLLGAALLHVDFAVVSLVGAGFFALNLIQTIILLPPVRIAAPDNSFWHGLHLVRQDRRFITYTGLMMGFWFMWVQINTSLPLVATRLTGTTDTVGLLYAVNAVMMVGLQYPLLRVLNKWSQPLPILAAGVLLMAVGLGSVALAGGLVGLIVSVIVFSLGALLVQPTHQTVTAELANQGALGSYFGAGALALAFGGGFGNFAGGALYGLGQQFNQPAIPWLIFGAVGLAAAAGLWWFARRATTDDRRPATDQTVAEAQAAR